MNNELSESERDASEHSEAEAEEQAEEQGGEQAEQNSEGTEVSGDEGEESSEGEGESKQKSVDRKVKLFDERYFEVEEEPPKLVVIQGPPQSGKTTLIKCLIKHYTKQTVSDPKGSLG